MANWLSFLLLFSLLIVFSYRVHGGKNVSWHEVPISSFIPADVCSSSSKDSDSTSRMELVHRHGKCSPLTRSGLSQAQILSKDQSRVDSIHRMSSAPSSFIPDHSGISLGTSDYIVTIGLGTPVSKFSVIFSTGTDISWVQCLPCVSCYNQSDPLYDPSQSSTYSGLPCSSSQCSLLNSPQCSSQSTCRYTVVYGDNSGSSGYLVLDTVTLTDTDSYSNFLFGCGDTNTAVAGGLYAGVIGLGRGPVAVMSQAGSIFGGVFSYCLPSTPSYTGYLNLGVNGSTPSNVILTQMLNSSNYPSFYFLDLVAISIANQTLPVPPTVFSTAGVIIDPGTVITRLPQSAYIALKAAFLVAMSIYPSVPPFSTLLDTCYDFTGYKTFVVPVVALEFGNGVEIVLDPAGIIYFNEQSPSQGCLAFAGNKDDTELVIIGNVQQRRLTVVYDLPNQSIGFGQGGCE